MTSADFFAAHLATRPVIGIFRGLPPHRTVELCEVAWSAGVALVEVPVQSPDALPSLAAAVEAARDRGLPVGAGTVTDADQADAVRRIGAAFLVSPGLHPEVVVAADRLGLPCLPGVATATEIAAALRLGLTWLKAFPAAQLTPAWVTAQHGPFPQVSFVATGGIDADNASAFLAAGCRAVAVGSAFTDPAAIAKLAALASPA